MYFFCLLCVLHKLYDAYGCSHASNARVWCTCVFNVPQHGLRQCLTIETRSCKILSGSALESGLLLCCMCADDIDSEKAVCQRITYKFLSQNNDDFHRSIHHVVVYVSWACVCLNMSEAIFIRAIHSQNKPANCIWSKVVVFVCVCTVYTTAAHCIFNFAV